MSGRTHLGAGSASGRSLAQETRAPIHLISSLAGVPARNLPRRGRYSGPPQSPRLTESGHNIAHPHPSIHAVAGSSARTIRFGLDDLAPSSLAHEHGRGSVDRCPKSFCIRSKP